MEFLLVVMDNEMSVSTFRSELNSIYHSVIVCFVSYQNNEYISEVLVIRNLNRIKFDEILADLIDTQTGIRVPISNCRILTGIRKMTDN